MVFCGACSM